MIENNFDIIVIGSGLGGLISACILGKEGYRVLVLEKNNQLGGNLQTFVRDKKIFDTGVHYIGGLDKGQSLHPYFDYLGIINALSLEKMDDIYDTIVFGDDDATYPYGQGKERFVELLAEKFPSEVEGIRKYVELLENCCEAFPLFRADAKGGYDVANFGLRQSVDEVISTCTSNRRLQAVLAGTNLLYAGEKGKTPFYVHALSVYSYLESAWKCTKGGSQIAKILASQIRKQGGKILKYQEVSQIVTENGRAVAVCTKQGRRFGGNLFISNAHPKKTLEMLGEAPLRKTYRDRILKKSDTVSSFSLYLTLNPEKISYSPKNVYYHKDTDAVWDAVHAEPSQWPQSYMLSMTRDPKNPDFAETATVFTYMSIEEWEKWVETRNTVAEKSERPRDYEEYKREKQDVLLREISKKFPDLVEQIRSSYASTPLTYRDYIGNENGALYGFSKSVEYPEEYFLPSRTKIKNLYMTGQHLNMHGIMGVTVSAFLTCSEILGLSYLIEKINAKSSA